MSNTTEDHKRLYFKMNHEQGLETTLEGISGQTDGVKCTLDFSRLEIDWGGKPIPSIARFKEIWEEAGKWFGNQINSYEQGEQAVKRHTN